MGRFLSRIVVLAVVVMAAGYYLDWFSFSTSDDPMEDKMEINVHVDKAKFKNDARKAKERAKGLERELKQQIEEWDRKAEEKTDR
ncbi:MAG TPA: hypothetical protein VK395_37490 [Gemmataceae bacterium]|nr:hypothetical protein [Gemmataceae bacterium]